MRNILNLIRLDFISIKGKTFIPVTVSYAVTLLIGIFIAPQMAVFMGTTMSFMLFYPIFSIAEKNGYNKLYGTIPVSRLEVILARFFEYFALGVLANVVFIIVGKLSEKAEIYLTWSDSISDFTGIFKQHIDAGYDSVIMASLSFFMFCFMLYELVLQFVFGVDKEGIASMIVLVGVLGLFSLLQFGFKIKIAEHFIDFYRNSRTLMCVMCYVSGVLLVAVYTCIAYLIMRKREL